MKNAAKGLNPLLEKSQKNSGWHHSEHLFKDADECTSYSPGCANMSPAWYDQGHKVSHISYQICHLWTLVGC
jgi:hypothetical protein